MKKNIFCCWGWGSKRNTQEHQSRWFKQHMWRWAKRKMFYFYFYFFFQFFDIFIPHLYHTHYKPKLKYQKILKIIQKEKNIREIFKIHQTCCRSGQNCVWEVLGGLAPKNILCWHGEEKMKVCLSSPIFTYVA
jgi:hypothetical protein